MSDNFFMAESPAPDEASLGAALGERYALYKRIMESVEGFEAEWRHYGKKYGWKLKVHDGEKALLELSAGPGGLRLAIAAREDELEELRSDEAAAAALEALLGPGGPKGGWAIAASVADEAGCASAVAILSALAEIRRGE